MSNLSITNEQIAEQFPEQMKSGKTFVAAIGVQNEKGFTPFLVCQNVSPLYSLPGDVSDVESEFLNFQPTSHLIRTIKNVNRTSDWFDKVKVGEILEGINLEVHHSSTPFYPGQTPLRKNKSWIVDKNGDYVFEDVKLKRDVPLHVNIASHYEKSDEMLSLSEMKEKMNSIYLKSLESLTV